MLFEFIYKHAFWETLCVLLLIHHCCQLLVVLLMATGLCDLGYTIYQDISGYYGGTAQFLYFCSSSVAVTMVMCNLVFVCACERGYME